MRITKRNILTIGFSMLLLCGAWAQGKPFLRNFSAAEYGAHNRNFDIVTGSDGTVYVANFEGLLYYDHAQWRILHTPSLKRIESVCRDDKDTIWAYGYKYAGKLIVQKNGALALQKAETPKKNKASQVLQLGTNLQAIAVNGKGLVVADKTGKPLYIINEQGGLCSNNISGIAYDGQGTIWGATDNGIFALSLPSPYSRFTQTEGLRGEVLCIKEFAGRIYVGTSSGLFYLDETQFVRIADIDHTCWNLDELNGRLMAATGEGVFSIDGNGSSLQVNTFLTRTLLTGENCFYSGEQDGVYLNDLSGNRKKISSLERVTRILKDSEESIWLQSMDGEVWKRPVSHIQFSKVSNDDAATMIIEGNGKVTTVGILDQEPFTFPQFSYTDPAGTIWLTDNAGRHLYTWKDGKRQKKFDELLFPLGEKAIRAMLTDGHQRIWLGGVFGLIAIDPSVKNPLSETMPKVIIRSVLLNGDSILWGGYGMCPEELQTLSNNERNLSFTYAITYTSPVGECLYRHRVNDGTWSAWSDKGEVVLTNQSSGLHKLDIQARDPLGRLSDITSVSFRIQPPFFLRWYMYLLYLLLLAWLIYALVRLRLRRLEHEKQRLEGIVQERTAEVVKQKDEIEEKSKRLESTLYELNMAQSELIRQEKMATVGKLTQGLIDRILNPLNYINNFTKLSEGLVKDVEANIEDEKEHMDAENYEDTVDVLGMLRTNLQKVGEHGLNTTRTLKAMEEMLKDRSGGMIEMDILPVLRQDHEMFQTYYSKEIAQYHISETFDLPDGQILINGNAEQLSKAIMSMLNNAVYALVKKAQKNDYQPAVTVRAFVEDSTFKLSIHDNGIGIEPTIIEKIFDPFFTTKTTGEASGVGLYLSREIAQNHGGDILVDSVKNENTTFTLTLPLWKNE